jgi:Flp pilus assembly protein TadD
LRAQVAELQSDAEVSRLERAALEKRLRQSQSGVATNAAAENNSGDFSASYQASPNQTETANETSSPNETEATMTAGGNAENNSAPELPAGSATLATEVQNAFNAHQYAKAEADYEKILQDDPKNSVALANLAAIEMEENKLSKAETHLQTALAENPDDAYNLSLEGYLQFREQKYDEALATLTRAAQLDPKNPQIQNYLGVTLSHKGRINEAESALLKAIELDPNYAAAHNNLAVIYINEDPPKSELARKEYQEALADGQPRNPDLEKLLASKGAPIADGK